MTSPQSDPEDNAGPATESTEGTGPKLGRYAAMKDEIARIQATATSPDRAVTVVAGPSGAVLDIRLSEHALRPGAARSLNGAMMSTLRLAVADAARQQAQVVQRYVGDRLNIVDRVMATQQELLGDKIEAGEQEQQRLAAQTRPPAEPAEGSVLRPVSQQPAPPPAAPPAPQPIPPAAQPPAQPPQPMRPPRPTPPPRVARHRPTDTEDYVEDYENQHYLR